MFFRVILDIRVDRIRADSLEVPLTKSQNLEQSSVSTILLGRGYGFNRIETGTTHFQEEEPLARVRRARSLVVNHRADLGASRSISVLNA